MLQAFITQNGAEYHADMTKNATHLVALKPEGEKYKYASLWGLKLVTKEWIQDSIERGMVLEENLYGPLVPAPERGRNAWIRRSASETSLGKRARDDSQSLDNVDDDFLGRRKLRRTTSKRLSSQNSSIWNDIVGGGFGLQKENGDERKGAGEEHGQGQSHLPAVNLDPRKENQRPSNAKELPELDRTCRSGLFCGQRMYLHGFDNRKVRDRPLKSVSYLHTN